jgi:hypothetical protein
LSCMFSPGQALLRLIPPKALCRLYIIFARIFPEAHRNGKELGK